LGPVLEKIIEKGLKSKSPNILLMASILGTHLSIYPEFQTFLFNREFIAYQMGLLEPSSSEYIQAWGANSQNNSETVMAGENLVFMQKIMSNTDIIIQMTSLMLNNLCHQAELAKILGSLPIKYGVKPLAKIFLIDKTKVSRLIQCLCLDSDFQSKMASFIPVDFKTAQKEIEEAENYAKGSKGASSFLYKRYESPTEKKEKKDKKKGEEEQKNPFEEMKELIHDPRSMSVTKGRDYHERITKIIFFNIDPDDLVWRRVIKVSMLHLKDESSSSILWMGKLLKPLKFAIDKNYVTFDDIQQINFDWEKKEEFYYKIDDLEDEVMPEESMSGIMKKLKVYPKYRTNPKTTFSNSASLLSLTDNNSVVQRTYDYEIDDPGLSVVNMQLKNPNDPNDSVLDHPNRIDPRRDIKGQVDKEILALDKQKK
jgi:hypothetical protein